MEVVRYGPNALLIRLAATSDATAFQLQQRLLRGMRDHPLPALIEITPALASVLLEFSGTAPADLQNLRIALDAALAAGSSAEIDAAPLHEIPVRYDGPDLGRVADLAGCTAAEVVERHAAPEYRVQQLGFSPGFAYLGHLDPRLHTPRLEVPRLSVPPGAVAIGGGHTGIYPHPTAGGWNLIGHTDAWLFRPEPGIEPAEARRVFRLLPGDRVRFIAVAFTRSPA